MKKSKSILALLLCSVMVLSSVLTSCVGDSEETKDPVGTSGGNEANGDGYEYHIENYNGETINILAPGPDDAEWQCKDFFEEGPSDEPIPDAVYNRKTKIERTFNVKINVVTTGTRTTINNMVSLADTANDIEYDIVMQTVPRCYTLAQDDMILNLNMFDHLDTTVDVWDQSYLKQNSIGGQNYFATGEITTMDNDATWVMMFNKKMAESRDMPDIYELVKSGDWTMDKLLELSADIYQDKTGDGVSSDDTYAIATTVDFIQGLFYGADGKIISKNEEDIPVLDFLNTKNTNLIDKIIDIYYSSNEITFDCHDYMSENPQVHLIAQTMFEENRALFYSEVMQCAIRLREMETEYGIIPVPKYDKAQKEYTTHTVADVTLAACFPRTLTTDEKRMQMAGAIAQALAVEGKRILTPAYYDKSLMQKGTRDEESQDMLDIIFKNRVSDLGYMIEGPINSLFSAMRTMIKSGQNNISSVNSSYGRRVSNALESLISEFEE